jgi:hypothetical protein
VEEEPYNNRLSSLCSKKRLRRRSSRLRRRVPFTSKVSRNTVQAAIRQLHEEDVRLAPTDREDSVAPLELVWPFVTVRMTVAGQQVRLLVDTGSSDLVLFKTRMPAALADAPWRGDKTVQYASGAARLRRLELRQVGLGSRTWDKLSAWAIDREAQGYPPGIDGVLGVLALGCQRVRFDFEKGELGWSR